MYFWTPHWAQEKYDLTMVQLPEVTPECEQAAADGTDAYACAYPQDDLYKAFNQDLQTKAPAAFAFLSAMSWTNDDQNVVALGINDGQDPAPMRRRSGSTRTRTCGSPGSTPVSQRSRRRHSGAGRAGGRRPPALLACLTRCRVGVAVPATPTLRQQHRASSSERG